MFKNCVPFKLCIIEINTTQADNDHDINVATPMCNLLDYSDSCSKTSESLLQYYKDEPASNNDGAIVDFADNNITKSIKFKQKYKSSDR